MRNYVLQWRRGAMGFVLAAACASSLTTTGCNRSSSRDVSIDLSKQAAESALRAERKIAERQRTSDQSDKGRRTEDIAGKVSLPGTRSDVAENPLAQLLAKQSEKYPSGDPFLKSSPQVPLDHRFKEQPATHTQASSELEAKVSLTQHVAARQTSVARSVQRRSESPVAKPFPANAFPSSMAAPQPSVDLRFADQQAKQVTVSRIKKTKQAFTPTQPLTSSAKLSQQSKSQFIPPTASSNYEFTSNELGQWQTIGDNLALKDSFRAFPVSDQPQAETLGSNQPNLHHKRMSTLLAKAKVQQTRGELHSAYRSALLAKSIVEQHQLAISTNETNPAVFASEIAAKIWGSRTSDSVKSKTSPQFYLPIIRPKQTYSAQHDQAFATPDHYLNWQASADQRSQGTHSSSQQSPQASIAKVTSRSMIIAAAASDSHQKQHAPKVRQLAGTVAEDSAGFSETVSQPVSLAFAQIIESPKPVKAPQKARPMPNRPIAVQAPVFVSNFGELRARPIAQGSETALSKAPDFLTTRSLPVAPEPELVAANDDATELASAKGVSSQTNAKWGILAFILAVISTLIGLKVSGGRTGKPTVSEAKEPNDVEQPQLKINKAA